MNTEHKSNTPKEIRDLWRTPKQVFDYYNRRYGFDLDLAASDKNHLCDHYLTESDDSLDIDSVMSKMINMEVNNDHYCESIWINPPYSNIRPWVEQAIYLAEDFDQKVVMLLPADTSVKWFELAHKNCTECHLITGRLAFINEATGKPAKGNNKGSVVFVFHPDYLKESKTTLLNRDELMK